MAAFGCLGIVVDFNNYSIIVDDLLALTSFLNGVPQLLLVTHSGAQWLKSPNSWPKFKVSKFDLHKVSYLIYIYIYIYIYVCVCVCVRVCVWGGV